MRACSLTRRAPFFWGGDDIRAHHPLPPPRRYPSFRVREAGLEDRIQLLLVDYRDLPLHGQFDKVVSIEMIEAVGHENLPVYFQAIGRALRPGGRAVLQAISEPDDRYDEYTRSSDFIREHIFPGGHLPCIGAMVEAMRGTGMTIHDTEDIGPDYAVTLRAWRKAWEERRDDALRLGYSDRFWRKFRFYFAYCEAAFDARYIHNFHVVITKDEPERESARDRQKALRLFAAGRTLRQISAAFTPVGQATDAIGGAAVVAGAFAAGVAAGYLLRVSDPGDVPPSRGATKPIAIPWASAGRQEQRRPRQPGQGAGDPGQGDSQRPGQPACRPCSAVIPTLSIHRTSPLSLSSSRTPPLGIAPLPLSQTNARAEYLPPCPRKRTPRGNNHLSVKQSCTTI